MNNRNAIAAALMTMHKTVETSPAYANAVADVLIALTEPQLSEAKKQTALLEKLVLQGDREALRKQLSPYDTSGLPG